MQCITHDELIYYQFDSLQGVRHGVFTRLGGVSQGPFHSLNVGATVGDAPENVNHNRQRIYAELAVTEDSVRTSWQVHGADVLLVNGDSPRSWPPPQADGIVTNHPGLVLMMRFADCVPLLFHDPIRQVAGIAHAGWPGTLAGTGPATVRAMQQAFACKPADIVAGIGPSIGPCCYEVGPEVVEGVHEAFDSMAEELLKPGKGERPHFDLWAANALALRQMGVTQIETARMCTSCRSDLFFSHRADRGQTGRFGAVIGLNDE
jgi:YfiH family protein